MRIDQGTGPQKCSRCLRTKEEAINEQKKKGKVCDDSLCVFKKSIKEAVLGGTKVFIWNTCPKCGVAYYKPISNYCHKCGNKRE